MRAATILALVLAVGGCAAYSLIEARRTSIGNLYTVEPRIRWSSTQKGKVELWTVDGPSLQAIRFVKGLDHDEGLFEAEKLEDKEKRPKFKKHMTPTEIAEFVVDSFIAIGAQKVETRDLRPQKFGEVDGFRFEMRFASEEGLEGQGFVVGGVVEEKLHLIIYTGARAHYYAKHKDDVERIIESMRMQ